MKYKCSVYNVHVDHIACLVSVVPCTVRVSAERTVQWHILLLLLLLFKKVNLSRYRTGVPQRVGKGIALLFHDHGTRRV